MKVLRNPACQMEHSRWTINNGSDSLRPRLTTLSFSFLLYCFFFSVKNFERDVSFKTCEQTSVTVWCEGKLQKGPLKNEIKVRKQKLVSAMRKKNAPHILQAFSYSVSDGTRIYLQYYISQTFPATWPRIPSNPSKVIKFHLRAFFYLKKIDCAYYRSGFHFIPVLYSL